MGVLVFFAAVAVMVWVWRAVARGMAAEGRGWYLRAVLGGTAGVMVFLVVLVAGAVMGAFPLQPEMPSSAIGDQPLAAETSAPAANTEPAQVPASSPDLAVSNRTPDGPVLDGDVPYGIDLLFGNESPSIRKGVLTLRLGPSVEMDVDDAVLSSRVGVLCMARWAAPEQIDEDGELSPPKLTAPAWRGITQVRVLNALGTQGLAFAGGDADCDAMPEHDETDKRTYIKARTVSAVQDTRPDVLADDTLHFLTAASDTLEMALESGDGAAIRAEINSPAFGLVLRWSALRDLNALRTYDPCIAAVDAMHRLTGALLDQNDSVDRRRKIKKEAAAHDAALPACRAAVADYEHKT